MYIWLQGDFLSIIPIFSIRNAIQCRCLFIKSFRLAGCHLVPDRTLYGNGTLDFPVIQFCLKMLSKWCRFGSSLIKHICSYQFLFSSPEMVLGESRESYWKTEVVIYSPFSLSIAFRKAAPASFRFAFSRSDINRWPTKTINKDTRMYAHSRKERRLSKLFTDFC